MSKSKPKIGERRDIGRVNNLTCKVRASTRTQPDGTELKAAFWPFSWKSDEGGGKGISMQIVSFGDNPDITEVSIFDPSGEDGLLTAFEEGIFLNPVTFKWEKFLVPEIGDYLKISGVHYEKWTVLKKSPNPKLKAGFWKPCIRCYSADQFKVRRTPPKPNAKQLLKLHAV